MSEIKVFYARLEETSSHKRHLQLVKHLSKFAVEVVEGEKITNANGIIVELTEATPELNDEVVRAKNELNMPLLVLIERTAASSLDERLSGLSAVNPNGVRYSAPYVANSAITVFMNAYMGVGSPAELDRLSRPLTDDPEAAGLPKADLQEQSEAAESYIQTQIE